MKKMLAALLACVLLLAALPAMAADNVRTSGDFQYTIKGNGTATIVGYTGTSLDIILPNLIDGYVITSIGDAAFMLNWDEALAEAMFSDGNYTGTVTLPNTITSIGEKAFWEFPIATINIPDSVEYIGYGAFAGSECDFRISNNHPCYAVIDGALYNKADKELIHGRSGAAIPEGIVSIGDYACYDGVQCGFTEEGFCFPSTLQRIGDYAYADGYFYFKKTPLLSFPENLTHIGNYAFADIHYGAYIADIVFDFPVSIEFIGEAAFRVSDGDEDITYEFSAETNIEAIGAYAFADVQATKDEPHNIVRLNGSIAEIGDYAFYHAKLHGNLASTQRIGEYAFAESWYETSVIIPDSCETIAAHAFENCSLRSENYTLTIGNGVEEIMDNAFTGMNSWYNKPLSDIYLPDSLKTIADNAFDKSASFVVEKGSYAKRWADDNAFTCTLNGEEQNLDWLNN